MRSEREIDWIVNKTREPLEARIRELEAIVKAQSSFLQELYATAGFRLGEQVSVPALIDRIRKSI